MKNTKSDIAIIEITELHREPVTLVGCIPSIVNDNL